MKKFTLFAVAAMIITFTANAQDIAFGVKAGANLANMTDVEGTSPGTRFGAHIGPFIKLPLTDNFSIIPELLYSMKGSEISESILGFNFEMQTNLDYLEIPIMANYQLESGLNFELGPYVGILLSAKSTVDILGVSEDVDIKDEMNTVDFGVGFGLGYRLENGLGFGARYSLGLASLFKEADVAATDPITGLPILDPITNQPIIVKQEAYGKNSNIMISVSWLFGQN